MKKLTLLSLLALTLTACGGGGGNSGTCFGSASVCNGSSGVSTPTFPSTPSTPGSIPPAAQYAGICVADAEKSWVRGHLDDVYLWYKDIKDTTPGNYSDASEYFYSLLVASKDRFSFTAPQAEIDDLFNSGEEVSYGLEYFKQGETYRIAFTEPGSPAAFQNITRGATIATLNGTPIAQMSREQRNAALYPSQTGQTTTFGLIERGASQSHDVVLAASKVTKSPVQHAKVQQINGKKVGYVQFNDHIATAEQGMFNAMNQFQQAGVEELVLDLRYNGGGFIYIASQVAAMIGSTSLTDKVFEKLLFNDKRTAETNDPDNAFGFIQTTRSGAPLPHLNLRRVFILTGPGTCSASESIINGVSPFVEVVKIGTTTCGKPYGFTQTNNCGTAYFAIEFSGVNHIGQGDYANGIAPNCEVADDLEHDLGDEQERLFAAAQSYMQYGTCPNNQGLAKNIKQAGTAQLLPRKPWREIRLKLKQ